MDVLEELQQAQIAWEQAQEHAAQARLRREKAARAAHAALIRPGKIAEVLKISPGRVTQIVAKDD